VPARDFFMDPGAIKKKLFISLYSGQEVRSKIFLADLDLQTTEYINFPSFKNPIYNILHGGRLYKVMSIGYQLQSIYILFLFQRCLWWFTVDTKNI